MNKNEELKKKLAALIASQLASENSADENFQDFDDSLESELSFFHPTAAAEAMDFEDRETLGRLYARLGTNQLKAKDNKFLTSFEFCFKIAKDSYEVIYSLGAACEKYPHNVQILIYAKKYFEEALNLQPNPFDALYSLARVLVQQGMLLEEAPFFQDAISNYEKAVTLIADTHCKAEFYRDFGQAWFYLGKLSGEAMDFRYALDWYKQACQSGMQTPSFWNVYGDAVIEMAFLIGKKEYFFEAIDHYNNSIKANENQFQGHFNLACAYQCVFEITIDLDYFEKANESFERAVKYEEKTEFHHAVVWLKWGQLLATLGKLKREISYLEQSLEKFMQADKIEPNHPGILSRFGEAEMLLGANTDEINLLRQAEDKFVRSLEVNPEAAEIWYLYGICLNELGRYFNDQNFYQSAIEKFQWGLSLNQTDPLLWYGLAMSNFALGDMLNDRIMIEKSIRYCSQVLEFGGQVFLQFWNDWAVGLMRLAEMTLEPDFLDSALMKFEELIKRQGENTEGEEIDLEWLYNYGCALDMHGDFTGDQNSYEKAVQILANVVKIDPEYVHARYNLALALSHLGESVSDLECLQKASEHFEILLSEDREDEVAWNDWGLCLLHQAELIDESCLPGQSKSIYELAEGKFFHALSLGSLPTYYNLACLYALNNNVKSAIHYMERAEAVDSLPPLDDIMHDEWLTNVKHTEAFRNFISALSNKPDKNN